MSDRMWFATVFVVGWFMFLCGLAIGLHSKRFSSEQIRFAHYCGVVEATRRASNEDEQYQVKPSCDKLIDSTLSDQDRAVQRCFDIYNKRPLVNGVLPYDAEVERRTDACFKEARHE